MKNFSYTTSGTCSQQINFSLDDQNRIHNLEFIGGCNGNLQGISHLVENEAAQSVINKCSGEAAQSVINKCSGIRCGMKPTSCPDQLAKALSLALQK